MFKSVFEALDYRNHCPCCKSPLYIDVGTFDTTRKKYGFKDKYITIETVYYDIDINYDDECCKICNMNNIKVDKEYFDYDTCTCKITENYKKTVSKEHDIGNQKIIIDTKYKDILFCYDIPEEERQDRNFVIDIFCDKCYDYSYKININYNDNIIIDKTLNVSCDIVTECYCISNSVNDQDYKYTGIKYHHDKKSIVISSNNFEDRESKYVFDYNPDSFLKKLNKLMMFT